MTIRDLQTIFFGKVQIDRAVNHADETEYVRLYDGSMSLLIDSDHKKILDSEIICSIPSIRDRVPILDITVY